MAVALPEIPLIADERSMLLAFLDHFRAALHERCRTGLTIEQMRTEHPPTTLTLARLLGHMAWVESWWFRQILHDIDPLDGFGELNFDRDPDAEMTLITTWSAEEIEALFDRAVEDARRQIEDLELDTVAARRWRDRDVSLRWIVVHMIEEYARHCGHADLIREAIDGSAAP